MKRSRSGSPGLSCVALSASLEGGRKELRKARAVAHHGAALSLTERVAAQQRDELKQVLAHTHNALVVLDGQHVGLITERCVKGEEKVAVLHARNFAPLVRKGVDDAHAVGVVEQTCDARRLPPARVACSRATALPAEAQPPACCRPPPICRCR